MTDPAVSREIYLVRRPEGVPAREHFAIRTSALPVPVDGEVRVHTLVWGVDPGLRGRLSPIDSYAPSLALGDVITGFVAGRVLESRDPAFVVGDVVTGSWGWREYANVPATQIARAPECGALPLQALLGALGIPGVTAYFGMLDVGALKPGDNVLVTSAAGGVGSIAAQIAKLHGARVVGLAGGQAKCDWLRIAAGVETVIDYKAQKDLTGAIARCFPNGIDVVFENVGNAMVDAVLPLMALQGRIVVCGQTADYNLPLDAIHGIRNTRSIIGKRLRIQGILAMDYVARYDEAREALRRWCEQGQLVTKEQITVGIENLPDAFASLFGDAGLGRKLVIADEA